MLYQTLMLVRGRKGKRKRKEKENEKKRKEKNRLRRVEADTQAAQRPPYSPPAEAHTARRAKSTRRKLFRACPSSFARARTLPGVVYRPPTRYLTINSAVLYCVCAPNFSIISSQYSIGVETRPCKFSLMFFIFSPLSSDCRRVTTARPPARLVAHITHRTSTSCLC